jgi:hypothetical protein
LAVEKEGEVEMVSLCLPVPGINNNASEESLMRRLGQALQSIQYGEGEEGATGGDDGESLPECASQWTLVVEGRSDRH